MDDLASALLVAASLLEVAFEWRWCSGDMRVLLSLLCRRMGMYGVLFGSATNPWM